MKKRISFLVFFIAISLQLSGCNKDKIDESENIYKNIETNAKESDKKIEENNLKLDLDGEITKVIISILKESDRTYSDLNGTLNDKETLKTFKDIISSATKEDGIANMTHPDFKLELIYENDSKQELNLWLGVDGQKSSLMKTDNTNIIYTISEELTYELIELLQ